MVVAGSALDTRLEAFLLDPEWFLSGFGEIGQVVCHGVDNVLGHGMSWNAVGLCKHLALTKNTVGGLDLPSLDPVPVLMWLICTWSFLVK